MPCLKKLLPVSVFAIFLFSFSFFSTSHAQSTISDGVTNWLPVSMEAANGHPHQTASQVFDIDKDGKLDIVIATRRSSNNTVVWYKNNGSSAWPKTVIEAGALNIEAGGAYYDIDGDGDQDVVFGGDSSSNGIWWWENPYPTLNKTWTRYTIKSSGGTKHHDMAFGDIDGDGKAEFITWNQGGAGLIMADIPANPKGGAWSFSTVAGLTGNNEGIAVADVDIDGTLDIVGAGRWYKHTGGTGFLTSNIDTSMGFTRTAVGQLIPGGRPEIIFACGDCDGSMKMYSWNGSAWQSSTLIGTVVHGHSIGIGDVNRDGKLDIFSGEMGLTSGNPKTYVLYNQGNGTFSVKNLNVIQMHHESRLEDMDNDGDYDIMAKPYVESGTARGPTVYINQTTGGITATPTPSPTNPGGAISLDKWKTYQINTRLTNKKYVFVYPADINKDGKIDVVTGDVWFKNPGSLAGNWERKPIGGNLQNVAAVYDFDNDGDIDILGTNGGSANDNGNPWGNLVSWAQNDGSGNFTIRTAATVGSSGANDFLQGAAVFKNNATIHVALSWHLQNDTNGVDLMTVPGSPTATWSSVRIANSQHEQLSAADIDRDGNIDILQGTRWLRNNGSGSWQPFPISNTSGDPDRNRLADINKDGRLDAVVGFEAIDVKGKIAWYEQPANATSVWTEHIVSNNTIFGPMSLDVVDMNRDGDLDIVVGEHYNNPAAKMLVLENQNNGSSWQTFTAGQGKEHHDGAQTADFDGDGDLDIVSIGWTHPGIMLYENEAKPTNQTPTPTPTVTSTPTPNNPGDANGDKNVNILDYQILANNFGKGSSTADFNKDNQTNILDYQILANNFGKNY